MVDEVKKLDDEGNEIIEEGDFDAEFNKIAEEKDGLSDELKPDEVIDKLDNPDDVIPGEKAKLDDEDPKPKEEEPDPYEGMSDEVKARVIAVEEENKKLQHTIKSDDGRVSAFQRKINGLETELNTVRQSSDKPKPSDKEVADAMLTEEGWTNFQKDYPEMAEVIDKRFDLYQTKMDEKLEAQKEAVDNTLAPVVERQHDDNMKEAVDIVANEFPKWQDAVKEDVFKTWIGSQPAAVQQLAESDDVTDASALISLFDNHRIANKLPSLRKSDHSPDDVVENKADEVAKRRERQLEDGATVIDSKSAKIDPNAESGSDFENAFNAYAKRNDAKRQA